MFCQTAVKAEGNMSLCGTRGGHTPLFSERCRLEPTHTHAWHKPGTAAKTRRRSGRNWLQLIAAESQRAAWMWRVNTDRQRRMVGKLLLDGIFFSPLFIFRYNYNQSGSKCFIKTGIFCGANMENDAFPRRHWRCWKATETLWQKHLNQIYLQTEPLLWMLSWCDVENNISVLINA